MISYDNSTIPPKENTVEQTITETPEQVVLNTVENPVIVEQTNAEVKNSVETDCAQTTSSATTNSTTNSNRRFNIQFQQKTKYIRDMWTQQRARINKDYSQFIIIIFICCIAMLCCIAALTTSNWSCDPMRNQYFGIWNTCYWPQFKVSEAFSINNNTTQTSNITTGMWCARQELWHVVVELAEQWRIDQVYASQGLMISGIVFYIFSIVCICLGWKFMRMNNMNYVRNAMITSLFVQVVAFWLLLIGFFLFIFTDRLSTSIILLFVYFALAIFVTNVINFITIEYKSYKFRQVSI